MYYYKNNKGKIELTEAGKFTLDFFGLTMSDLKKMTPQQLINHCKKFGDVLNDGSIRKTGDLFTYKRSTSDIIYGGGKGRRQEGETVIANHKGDSGSFSRYFDMDAWWKERIKKLPKEVQKTFPFLIVPKASKSEKNIGLDNLEAKNIANPFYENLPDLRMKRLQKRIPNQNIHPTIKPLSLISYLIILGSREGDIILDPFIGSGTTAIACRLLVRNFIGIEIEKEYLNIANARIAPYMSQKTFEDFF